MNAPVSLVFDFDGTICRLFKDYDLRAVSKEIHEALLAFGLQFQCENDPFDVFPFLAREATGKIWERAASVSDTILKSAERKATETCEKVYGFDEIFPRLCKKYRVGISTNNSVECVKLFFKKNELPCDIPMSGRQWLHPERMKPNPWTLENVATLMNSKPADILYIGDTQRDYKCARQYGCEFLGMAYSTQKREKLAKFLNNEKICVGYYELFDFLENIK